MSRFVNASLLRSRVFAWRETWSYRQFTRQLSASEHLHAAWRHRRRLSKRSDSLGLGGGEEGFQFLDEAFFTVKLDPVGSFVAGRSGRQHEADPAVAGAIAE